MSAGKEIELNLRLVRYRGRREAVMEAETQAALALVDFCDMALLCHWNWTRIGETLGMRPRTAEKTYERERRTVRGG